MEIAQVPQITVVIETPGFVFCNLDDIETKIQSAKDGKIVVPINTHCIDELIKHFIGQGFNLSTAANIADRALLEYSQLNSIQSV